MYERAIEELERIHDEVDRIAGRLTTVHRERLLCARGCYDCCIDEITVFEVEAERIRCTASDLLTTGEPHPQGRCAFLSPDGACRIYRVRPYVCRTQGFPVRWIGETEDGSLGELRDICQLNEEGLPVEELPRSHCWEIGPFEERLASLQRAVDGGEGRRVRLRDLFERHG